MWLRGSFMENQRVIPGNTSQGHFYIMPALQVAAESRETGLANKRPWDLSVLDCNDPECFGWLPCTAQALETFYSLFQLSTGTPVLLHSTRKIQLLPWWPLLPPAHRALWKSEPGNNFRRFLSPSASPIYSRTRSLALTKLATQKRFSEHSRRAMLSSGFLGN